MQHRGQDRWIQGTRNAALLVSLLGLLGLLAPAQAYALSVLGVGTEPTGVAVSAGGEAKYQGRHQRFGRGKSKHQKRVRVGVAGETSSTGKVKLAVTGRGRQEKRACAAAFDRAKEIARDSQFRAAKEWFARCARPGCARSLRQQCASLEEQVAAALPSVVPIANDVPGSASHDVEVRIDGEMLTSNLDGTAIIVDPGHHEFSFAKDGVVFATRNLAIEKGRRNQLVEVSFPTERHKSVALAPTPAVEERAAAPKPKVQSVRSTQSMPTAQITDAVEESGPVDEEPAPRVVRKEKPRRASIETDPKTGAPWSAYALAGVGVLGLGGYGVFVLKARADNDGLAALCKPDCMTTSVHHVRNLYLAADISLGIGVAALLGSTYLFLRDNNTEAERSPSRTSHISGLSVAPTSSGALATVGGTF